MSFLKNKQNIKLKKYEAINFYNCKQYDVVFII